MNNTLEGINSRITEAEEWISELENRMVEITASEHNIEKNEDILRDLWDNIKHTNIHIIGIPEGKEGEKGPKKLFEEIIAENFPSTQKIIWRDNSWKFPQHGKGNSQSSSGSKKSPRQDKPKEEHTETHSNQTD